MIPRFKKKFTELGKSSDAPNMNYSSSKLPGDKTVSVNFLIAAILFGFMAVASVVLFGYSIYLDKRLDSGSSILENSREQYKPEVVKQIISFKKQIDGTRQILSERMPSNRLLSFVEGDLVRGINVDSITIERTDGNTYEITIDGDSSSLTEYIRQTEVFRDSRNLSGGSLTLSSISSDLAEFTFEVSKSLLTTEAARLLGQDNNDNI